MVPVQLEVMLHYYYSPVDHPMVESNPPIWTTTRRWFLEAGLLETYPEIKGKPQLNAPVYKITERGRAFVKALCDVPLPVQAWVTPRRT